MIFSYIIAAGIVLIAVGIWRYVLELWKFVRSGIPGPVPFPIVGNVSQFTADPLGTFLLWSRKYPEGIFQYSWFGRPVIVVVRPDEVSRILKCGEDRYVKLPEDAVQELVGQGLVFSIGDKWHRMRRLVSPAFAGMTTRSMTPIIVQRSASLVQKWVALSRRGESVFVYQDVCSYTLSVLWYIGFGKSVRPVNLDQVENNSMDPRSLHFEEDVLDERVGKLAISVTKMAESKLLQLLPYDKIPILRSNREQKESIEELRSKMRELIIERREKVSDEQAGEDSTERKDLISRLLQAGKDVTDDELIDQMMTFLIAGHDTTSNLIAFLIGKLCEHSDICEKAIQEVDRVFPRMAFVNSDNVDPQLLQQIAESPVWASVSSSLPYIHALVDEVSRLYPSVPMTTSRAVVAKDEKIGGYPIPEGTTVEIWPWLCHRYTGIWKDADLFDPARFYVGMKDERLPENESSIRDGTKENARSSTEEGQSTDIEVKSADVSTSTTVTVPTGSFIPFGLGPRACVGNHLARLETYVFVVVLLQSLRPSKFHGPAPVPTLAITMKPTPFRMEFALRSKPAL